MSIVHAGNPFGVINPPVAVTTRFGTVSGGAFGSLINTVLNLFIVVAGVYAVFNFVLAGFSFLSAGGDPKKVENAWKKIYISVLGLAVAAGTYVLAALIGYLLFRDFDALLSPVINY